MVYVEWWYAREGPGQVADIVSHLPGVQAAVKEHASDAKNQATVLLNTLPRVRTGASQVTMHKGDLDWYVSIVDPSGKGGAAGIEKNLHILGQVF